MKKILLLTVALVLGNLSVYAGIYHEHDKAKLRAFLVQTSARTGVANGERLGLTASQMATLETGETWITSVKGVTWNTGSPKRITKINWNSSDVSVWDYGVSTHELVGTLDLAGCTELTTLDFSAQGVAALDVSGCTALSSLLCCCNGLTELNLSSCTELIFLHCEYNTRLTELDVSHSTLMRLYCYGTPLTYMAVGWNTPPSPVSFNALSVEHPAQYTLPTTVNDAVLRIPVGTSALYRTASAWRGFGTIVEEGITIPTISVSAPANPLVIPHTSTVMQPIEVSSNVAWTWTVTKSADASWLTVTQTSGSFNCTINVNAEPNETLYSRDATITVTVSSSTGITRKVIKITQVGLGSYHENEKAMLRAFLNQGSNASRFNLTTDDIATWEINETWIYKVTGVTWNYSSPMRIATLNWSNKSLAGNLDISGCAALTDLNCRYNQLTTLNVSGCTALTNLDCSSNQLTTLDVSNNTALTRLICYGNLLTTLNVNNNTALQDLLCSINRLTTLDVSNNTALTWLSCDNNQLTTLDVSNNTALTYLDCSSNRLTTLDVNNNTALEELRCSSNQLGTLDVSNNTALTYLDCSSNQLPTLDVNNNTALRDLSCGDNQLTTLNVNNNTALTELYCGGNQLTTLNVNNNTALTRLDCSRNQLTALNVSNNTALTRLYCNNNQLTTLDVSNNTALTGLSCDNNPLTTLDVSNNTALEDLYCDNNQLTTLDVSNNTALEDLYCTNNPLTSITVGWTTPSSLSYHDLSSHYTSAILYVPVGSISAYKAADIWKNFNTILETLTPTLNVNTSSLTFPQVGSTQSVTITANVAVTVNKSPADAAWLTYNMLLGTAGGTLNVTAAANTTTTQRTATITLSGTGATSKQITVTQPGIQYHETDKATLRAFLSQPSAVSGKTNGEQLGLTTTDMSTWENDETWITKVRGVSWHADSPKRINYLSWTSKSLAGNLDLSGCVASTGLYCSDNQLTAVNVSNNAPLITLICNNNQLTNLDVSNNTALIYLACHDNQLTTLDVSNNTALTNFTFHNNQLTTLDVSNNTALTYLYCYDNQLTSITVGWTTPPSLSYLDLSYHYTSAILYVPVGSVSAYKAANVWKNFKTILEAVGTPPPVTPSLTVNANSLTFPQAGSTQPVTVTANVAWAAAKSPTDATWLSFTPSSGTTNGTIDVTANVNTTTSQRTATITISGSGVSKQVSVTQAGIPVVLTALPETLTFPQGGAMQQITVTANVAWAVTTTPTSVPWLTITSSGTTNGTINVTATANTTTSPRQATIIVSGGGESKQVTVTQAGLSYLSVNTLSLDLPNTASTPQISVESNVTWSVSKTPSTATWLSFSPASSSGNGTINLTVQANTTTASRSATIIVNGGSSALNKEIIVTQAGTTAPTPPAALSVSTTPLSFPVSGSAQSVAVTSNVSWSVSKDPTTATWLTLGAPSSTSDGTFSVTAVTNSTTSPRTATITVSGTGVASKQISVSQSGIILTVDRSAVTLPRNGSSQQLSVTSNVSWSAVKSSSDASWLTVTSSVSGGTIDVSAGINPTATVRSATISVRDNNGVERQQVTVSQSGLPLLDIGTSALDFSSAASSEGISVSSNLAWAVSKSPSTATWLTYTPSGTSDGTITVSATANDATSTRTATLTVSGLGVASKEILVTQAGQSFVTVDASVLEFQRSGSMQPIAVSSNVSWSVTTTPSNVSWFSLSTTGESGNGVINVTVFANGTTDLRTATITITGSDGGGSRSIEVRQYGIPTLSLSATALEYTNSRSTQRVNVTSNVTWSLSKSPATATWLSLSTEMCTSDGTNQVTPIDLTASANTTTSPRSVTLTFTGNGFEGTRQVTITQSGVPTLTTPTSSLSFAHGSSTQYVSVTSNLAWAVSKSPSTASWLSFATGAETLTVSALSNSSTSPRSATLTLSATGVESKAITVTQAGVPTLTVLPTVLSFVHGGSTQPIAVTSNVSWTVSKSPVDASWLTLGGTTSGVNDGTISVTASPNETTFSRSASLTLSNSSGTLTGVVSITQAAKPYLSVIPSDIEFAAGGESGSIVINSNISWSIMKSPAADWLSLSSSSGTLSKTIDLTSSSNSTGSSRSATLTISGTGASASDVVPQLIEIIQFSIPSPAPPPFLSVEPETLDLISTGGSDLLVVSSNVAWTVRHSSSWLSVDSEDGTGNGIIEFSATDNDEKATRHDTLIVSGGGLSDTVLMRQAGIIIPDVLHSTPVSLYFGAESATDSIFITSNVPWQATNAADWVNITPVTGSTGDTIVVSVQSNESTSSRMDTIVIRGEVNGSIVNDSIFIMQSGIPLQPRLSVHPKTLSFRNVGGVDSIFVDSSSPWVLTHPQPWASVDLPVGLGNDTITLTVQPNPTADIRVDTIVITSSTGKDTVIVKQDPADKTILPNKITLNHKDTILGLGNTLQLDANVTPEGSLTTPLTWTSTKTNVAIVVNGFVAAVGLGKTNIIVQTTSGVLLADTCSVTVNNTSGVWIIDEHSLIVRCVGDALAVNTPFAENIHVYSTAGILLYLQPKLTGKANFNISHLPKGVLLIHGSSGWTRKIIHH